MRPRPERRRGTPRLARWLLQHALPYRDRPAMLGDLDEEFAARRREGRPATAWYWRQAIGSLPHAVRRRTPHPRQMLADARFTLRLWRRQPAFAVAAIATQAVGIAVTTAVIAVAYAVLVRPLPYRDPDRVILLFEGTGRSGQLSYQDFLDLRRACRGLESLGAYSGGSRTLTVPGQSPERVAMLEVTDGFLESLGVAPAFGRQFTAADLTRGGPNVVILAHETWMRRFGSNPSVVGSNISLNGSPHEVIGILPASFAFPLRGRPELWLPLRPSRIQEERGYMHWMGAIGRPRPDVTLAQLQSELESVARLYAERDPKNHTGTRLRAIPLKDMIVAGVRPTIQALLGGVALVMLVTCATAATLLLSRAAPRRRELTVRTALGATRGRIVGQLLTENLLLAIAGGAIGIAAGHWLLEAFVAGMPLSQRLVLPHFDDPGVGLVVGAAALALSIATGVVFGVIPAWRAARFQDGESLRTVRVTGGPVEGRLRASLVTLQVAIALVLLACAALLGASVRRLLDVPLVTDQQSLVTFRLNLPVNSRSAIEQFNRHLLEALMAAPGVSSAALINQPPLAGSGNNGTLHVAGRPDPVGPDVPVVAIRTISEGYFTTMQVPVVKGRGFTSIDTATSPQVVVINRVLADSVFAGSEPLGQRISFQFLPGEWQIVGIVDNERFDDVDRPLLPVVYFAMPQDTMGSFTVMLRAIDTGAAVETARAVINRLDPQLPMFGVRTIEQTASDSSALYMRRATLWMLGMFAAASLLLAAMGLYGVLAQSVADRTREIGVRVALGASRGRIAGLILRSGLRSVAIGAVLGIAGTLVASGWLASLLYGIGARDPLVIGAATLVLVAIALIACVVPTRRALAIDPATAVRVD